MSNAKVERRKQEKYNRKKNELKRKVKDTVVGIAVALIILAMAGVMLYQIFDDYIKYDTIQDIDLTAMVEAVSKVESASVEEDKTEDAEVEVETDDAVVDNEKKDDKSEDKKEDKEEDKEKK